MAEELKLKSYRLKERKDHDPDLPQNPYLAPDSFEKQLKKLAAAPKFKVFKLFHQEDLGF